jgi:ribosomal protein S1
MRKCLALCVIMVIMLVGVTVALGQDRVHLFDGTVVEGKVVEVNPTSVKVNTGEGGLIRVILISDIEVIVYENGQVETFAERKKSDESGVKQEVDSLKQTMHKGEVRRSQGSGILMGVGICIGIVLLLALV